MLLTNKDEILEAMNKELVEASPSRSTLEWLTNTSNEPPASPNFKVGDTVKVHFRSSEVKPERNQIFEGLVIHSRNSKAGKFFTVRKSSYGVGTERVFPLHSPRIELIEVIRTGKVSAKLFYALGKIGKGTKIKERNVFRKARSKVSANAATSPVDEVSLDQ